MEQAYPPLWGYHTVDIFDCPPFEMFTNNDDPRLIEIIHLKKFEPQSMKLWCQLACTATRIIDVGSHVGVYALAAAALRPDLKIYAFEPNPHAYARLRVNKMRNAFLNISEHNFAIGSKEGVTPFSWGVKENAQISSSGRVGLEDQKIFERAFVHMATLDSVRPMINKGNRGLIKIDVEGAESDVFQGMTQILQELRPDIILETFSQKRCDFINSVVLPLGYCVYDIDEQGLMKLKERLTPATIAGSNLNQFLTIRPLSLN